MAVNLSPVGGVAAQFFDNSGNVLTGGLLYSYLAGTTTPAISYTSSNGITAHTNPIVLDAAGRVSNGGEIWLTDGISYKFVLKDSNDVQIASWDNIIGINSNFVNYTGQSETQTATQGQTIFTLTTIQYEPATNSLAAYVNGSKQVSGVNYQETSSTVVTFIDGLNVGDVVEFNTAEAIATNAIDSVNVAYNEGGTGAVSRNVKSKLQESVSVKDFGAVGDGVTDDTAAFNLATQASLVFTSFSDAPYREIYIPAGQYRINGLVYVRKGQHLRGAGMGATYLDFTNNVSGTNTNTGGIVLGKSSAGVADPTGLPVEVSEIFTLGGATAIDCSPSGASIHSCFFSSPITGVNFSGADLVLNNCIFDNGTSLLLMSGQNATISNCIFYLGNQQIYLVSANDINISNCVFEYPQVASVYLQSGSNANININGSTFLMNAQFAGHEAYIYSAASTNDTVYVSGCSFRNGKAAIYKHTSGSTYASFKACFIDGVKTLSSYAQSSTAYGIDAGGVASVDVDGCTFKNMYDTVFKLSTASQVRIKNCDVDNSAAGVIAMSAAGGSLIVNNVAIKTTGATPITFAGTSTQSMSLSNVSFASTGGTYDITISGASASASVNLVNITGSGRQLYSYTGTTLFTATNLNNWLDPVVVSTSRYVKIPYVGAQTYQFSVTGNPNAGGSAIYRKSAYGVMCIDFDFQTGTPTTFVWKSTLFSSTAATNTMPTITAELQSLGNGNSLPTNSISNFIILSWPTTFTQETIAVTPINGVVPV